jgi:hypothetical protein
LRIEKLPPRQQPPFVKLCQPVVQAPSIWQRSQPPANRLDTLPLSGQVERYLGEL